MMRQEPEIHALLLAETTVLVAPILAFDESHSILPRDFVLRDFVLMERLPGLPLSDRTADEEVLFARVGECLAQAHTQTAEQYGYLGAHRPMAPQPTWQDAFLVMWNKLIDDIVNVGFYDAEESNLMRRLLDRHIALFERAVPASLLHMDVWHQNILVDEGGSLSGLVDWDRALWGDPEIEFAVLDYCGISRPAFWEGYGSRRDESPEARIRLLFYLLYEVQKYIVIRAGRRNDPAAATGYKRQSFELARQIP